jgi:hypothetical protein
MPFTLAIFGASLWPLAGGCFSFCWHDTEIKNLNHEWKDVWM